MNKAKILICSVVTATALTACSIEDNPNPNPVINPQDSATVVIDNPNEAQSDQPAYAPGL
ncbi:MAG: hypothetical protein IJ929_11545 [Prevotella sp.]|jgi:hypothetical protein|nr:hypothetical protein [Prevotella sp.]